jgi:hypothetical protein
MPTLADLFGAIDSAKRDPAGAAAGYGRGMAMNIGGLLDALSRLSSAPPTNLRETIGNAVGATGVPSEQAGELIGGVPGTGTALKALLAGAAKAGPTLGLLGQMVYHGTPHKFDRFDLSKIGTGEGAQVYGHGMYFADSPQTAKSYREILSKNELALPTGERLSANTSYGGSVQDHAAQYIEMQRKIGSDDPVGDAQKYVFTDLQSGLKKGMNDPGYISNRKEIIDQLQQWKDAGVKPVKGGALLAQDLPDEMLPKMLQWDKPLSEQPEAVKKALRGSSIAPDESVWPHYTGQSMIEGEMAANGPYNSSGWASSEAQPLIADKLRYLGIPGLSYLDAGSRSAGKGTMNHVVWDQDLLDRMSQTMKAID